MRGLKKLYNYFFYCGIDKEEYNAVKKDAYVSNFVTWRILHFLIAAALVFLFITSLFNNLLKANQLIYFAGFLYSIAIIILFFVLKKDSIIAQFLIYLTISLLFLLGCLITLNNINVPATTFIVFLLITPMFMIDKPIYGKTFINNEIVGRFGGDEFIIFIKNTDNHDEARTIADKIIKQASEDVTIPNTTEKISLSIGIAIYNG